MEPAFIWLYCFQNMNKMKISHLVAVLSVLVWVFKTCLFNSRYSASVGLLTARCCSSVCFRTCSDWGPRVWQANQVSGCLMGLFTFARSRVLPLGLIWDKSHSSVRSRPPPACQSHCLPLFLFHSSRWHGVMWPQPGLQHQLVPPLVRLLQRSLQHSGEHPLRVNNELDWK